MTQPPADILFRIERLLSAGKQQEARLLLEEYIKLDPASARAWWLMSLTLTDVDQQVDCLKRVLLLDPENEPARERLAKLLSQPPFSSSVSPFAVSGPSETEKPSGEIPPAPAWAAPTGAVPETVPWQPAEKQPAPPATPVPVKPAGEGMPPRKSKPKRGIVASARAWWLMSLTLTDVDQQVNCLKRVLLLDPENEPARERLAKLLSQPPFSSSVSPFAVSGPSETEKSAGEIPPVPTWAALTGAIPETVPWQPTEKQPAPPATPVPVKPAGEGTPPRKSKPKRGIVSILLAVFTVCVFVSLAGYLLLQRNAQAKALALAQAHNLQDTLAVAQTLTSLPLPTLVSTWTASPTQTALPTATFTGTPTFTPTRQFTLTKTPRPSGLTGAVVGLYAPDFSLLDVAFGQRVTLSQFDGQPVLLLFWATWYPHCDSEIESIKTIIQIYKDTGLVVLTINVGEDPATVTAYRRIHQLTFPILLDSDSKVKSVYSVDAIPGHFFIDSSGKIAFIEYGEMTLDEMKAQVDAVLRPYPTSTP